MRVKITSIIMRKQHIDTKKKNTSKRHVEINVPSLTIDKRFYNISVPNLKSIYKKSELNQLIT